MSELQPSYPFLLTTVNYTDPDTAFNNESVISIVTAGEGVGKWAVRNVLANVRTITFSEAVH